MAKKIFITEAQLAQFLLTDISLNEMNGNKNNVMSKIKKLIKSGIAISAIVLALMKAYNMGKEDALEMVEKAKTEQVQEKPSVIEESPWILVASNVEATVYNAEPKQCNADIAHTASMFRLNLKNVLSHRIIAMERTMMTKHGLKYGDVVKIEGTGKWDGVWQIQDTMNKRFAGKNKIDILLPKSKGLGKWNDVKVYKLSDKEDKANYKTDMAPQLSKKDAAKQIALIKKGKWVTT